MSSGQPIVSKPVPPPKCPRCRWILAFEGHENRWRGRCYNVACPQGEVNPPHIWEADTLAIVDSFAPVTSSMLADALGLGLTAASMRLRTLYDDGVLRRARLDGQGKRFAYERQAA